MPGIGPSRRCYIPETKLSSSEKRAQNRLPIVACTVSGVRKTEMRELIIVIAALLCASASTASPVTPRPTKRVMITRIQRCEDMQHQFNHAISQHAKAKRAAEARALQKKAQRYCAGKRQAQGIRAYAEALKLLGVQPIDR